MSQENSVLLSAHNICVTKGKTHILQNISLEVLGKDFVTIIGPNGAGKSMLLKCLMGFYKPSSGHITKKQHLKIGYVPQRLYCDQTMPITVKQFITLGNKYFSDELENIYQETLISDYQNTYLYNLSGGQLQRVLLARALLNKPELLILDEPAQNLDITGQLSFYKLLDEIYASRHISILMVSHDLHMVMASSKQVICLFKHICCSGEPKEITKDPQFTAIFGTDMAKMLAFYQHNHNHTHDHSLDTETITGACNHGHSS